jgi:CheY-like chemotaxis protein
MIRHKLEAEGVACDMVTVGTKDGFEAALAREPFDLILSDYNLPGYDGVSALTYAQQARPDAPVILISGTVGDEEGVRCLHLGATDYLLKDRLERLVPAVQRAIQEAEARRTRKLTGKAAAEQLLNRSLVEHLRNAIRQTWTPTPCSLPFQLRAGPRDRNHADRGPGRSRSFRENVPNGASRRRQVVTQDDQNPGQRHTVAGQVQWIHAVESPTGTGKDGLSACSAYRDIPAQADGRTA